MTQGDLSMEAIFQLRDRLTGVEAKLGPATERADAEAAFLVAHGNGGPWTGAAQHLEDLKSEANDLRNQIRGHELQERLDEAANVDQQITRADAERLSARASLKALEENPTIIRWLAAPQTAREAGLGYYWQIVGPWFSSNKTRREAPAHLGAESAPDYPPTLRFTDEERSEIRAYLQVDSALRGSEMAWHDAQSRKREILSKIPELEATS
jgi:hypothetical protein